MNTNFKKDKQRECETYYIHNITIAVPIGTPIGIAVKCPKDKNDKEVGRSLAFFRMKGV